MPLLSIQTNVALDNENKSNFLAAASQLTAKALGKPESYVMVSYQHNPDMLFAGSNQALAYLELKSLGLPEQQTPALSAQLCEFMQKQLKLSPERIYIEFTVGQRALWGYNGATF